METVAFPLDLEERIGARQVQQAKGQNKQHQKWLQV